MILVDTETVSVITEVPNEDTVVISNVNGDSSNLKYTIQIPVTIDLRQALQYSISTFTVKVLKKPFNTILGDNFMSSTGAPATYLGPFTPECLNEMVANFSEQNMISYFNQQKDNIVETFDVDFKKVLNDQVMSRFASLTDEELFGTEQVVITEPINNNNKDEIDLTVPLNSSNSSKGVYTLESAIDMLYQEGGDPAASFQPMQDELSYLQSQGGLTITDYDSTKSRESRLNLLHNSIRAVFEGETVNPTSGPSSPSSQTARNSAIRFKTYEINESLRYQKVLFNIKVDSGTLALTGDQVHIAIMAYDMFGMIMDVRAQSYNFPLLAENLTLFLPKIKASATRTGINRDIITLGVINEGGSDIEIDVYFKVTSECGSLDLMRFVKSHNDLIIPAYNQVRIKYTSIETDSCQTGVYGENLYSGGSVLFRVVPKIQKFDMDSKMAVANTYFASLGAKTLERNVLIPIMCFNQKDHIRIQTYNVPGNVRMLQVVKRDLTRKQIMFQPIRNEDGSAILIESTDAGSNSSFKDYDVIDEHVYEYKVKIVYGAGESYLSLNSFGIEYLMPDNKINASLDSSFNNTTSLWSGTYAPFRVKIEKTLTPADTLFNQISDFKQTADSNTQSTENTLFALFSEQLGAISSMIYESIMIRVVRHDMKTGDMSIIGDFNVEYENNSSGKGTAVVYDGNSMKLGRTYIYEVTPIVKSVFDLLVDIRSRLKEIAEQAQDSSRNLILQLLQGVEANVASTTGNKFYTRDVYKKGTIQSAKQYVEQVNGDVLQYGRNGNKVYFTLPMPNAAVTMRSTGITKIKTIDGLAIKYGDLFYSNTSQGNTVTWVNPEKDDPTGLTIGNKLSSPSKSKRQITYNKTTVKINMLLNGNLETVDYGVLTCIKNNIKRIVGSFHVVDSQKYFQYLDISQNDYQGIVEYQGYLVLENKEIQGPFKLGRVILGNK